MNEKPISHKNWDVLEMKQSYTWRKLTCVKHAFQSFFHFLRTKHVKCYSDNQGVVSNIRNGSSKLHKLALEIFLFCKEYDIAIDVEWIPRSETEIADYLSKVVDYDDWSVKELYYRIAESLSGPFAVDCFANSAISKICRFFSCFTSLGV